MNAKVNISNRAGASFPVRRMDFEFGEVPRYWAANDAGLTHFMTTLSALFPEGEQFFVDSTRAVRKHPKLSDPDLQREISAFIGQEAMHSKEHLAFNSSAQSYGYDIRTMEQQTGKVIRTGTKVLTTLLKPFGVTKEMIDLTGTCALEHFTAVIAAELLQNKDVQAMFNDSTMHQLWMWHAVEENEHKAVAYDVYESVFGTGLKAYSLRTTALVFAMVLIFILQSYFTLRLLQQDKKLNLKELGMIYKYAYSPSKGIITGMAGEMLAYFRPRFHPNDLDTVQLLKDWNAKLGF